MSTYSTNLKIELIGTGEQAGTWGVTTDDNFSNVFEQSIVGRVTVPFSDADVTLTATNSVSSQSFRNVYLNCTGTNTASKNLIVPTINKNYVVQNNTTGGFSIVVKTSAGTGITVPNGKTCTVYADGTNVIQAFDYLPTATLGSPLITTSGGTGLSSYTAGDLTYYASGTALSKLAIGTNGYILKSTGSAPTWVDPTTIIGGAGGSNTQVQYNSSGSLAGSANMVFDGTNLTVLGSISTTISSKTAQFNAAGGSIYSSYNDATKTWRVGSGIQSAGLFSIYNATDAVTAVNIDSSGNVGIGTASPSSLGGKLVVTGGQPQIVTQGSVGAGSQITMYANGTSANGLVIGQGYSSASDNVSYISNQATADMVFRTAASERMRIDVNGNVGIGTASPQGKLAISAAGAQGLEFLTSSATSIGIQSYNRSTSAYIDQAYVGSVFTWTTGGVGERMRIDSSGNVGIGTSSPGKKLDVNGITRVTNTGADAQLNIEAPSGYSNFAYWRETGVANRGVIGFANGSANMQIRTNGAYDLSTGTLSATVNQYGIGVGTAVPSSGTGISFPATQSASSDANCLDDYEEGTWTPTGVGQTFASATGKYTKIGRVVYISFDLVWSTNGAGNQAGFSGFPFASDGSVFSYTRGTSSYSGSIVMTSPGYAGTASGVLLYNFGNPGISDSAMSGLTLAGEGFYFVS